MIDAGRFRRDPLEQTCTRLELRLQIRELRIHVQPLLSAAVDHDSEYQSGECVLSTVNSG